MSKSLNSQPVSLPGGSYNFGKLRKGLDHAAEAAPEKRSDAVKKALEDAGGVKHDEIDHGRRADQKRIDRKHPTLGVTESVLVHDPKSDAAKAGAEEAEVTEERAVAEAEAQTDQQRAEASASAATSTK